MTEIPLVDLRWQHEQVAHEIDAGLRRVMSQTAFVLGDDVARFERRFAEHCGVAQAVGVANGTDAIELALRALQVRAGDEVILPANTFIATAEAVVRAGATPVLVDVDPATHLLDVEQVADRLGPRSRAVIPVHLYGQAAPVEQVIAAVDGRDVVIVEDMAQAQGARRHGRPAGSMGDAGATSFYPGKNLGAYGDAGAVVTDRADVADLLRMLRNHGGQTKYVHDVVGMNSRLDTLQAVVLNAKLDRLDKWNQLRQEAASAYDRLLADVEEVRTPAVLDGNAHVWHLYVVQVPQRDDVLRHLHEQGIGAGIHYPRPVHLQPAFSHLGHRAGSFPHTERVADAILSLPLYPGIEPEQQVRVVESLGRALGRR